MGALYGKDEIDYLQVNKKMWEAFGEEGTEMYPRFMKLLRDREKVEFWLRKDLSYTKE
jgi:hypothetical protein